MHSWAMDSHLLLLQQTFREPVEFHYSHHFQRIWIYCRWTVTLLIVPLKAKGRLSK